MNLPKHTPAPWKRRTPYSCVVVGASGHTVAVVYDGHSLADPNRNEDEAAISANIALICAAPELLTLLKKTVADIYDNTYIEDWDVDAFLRAASKLIEKAEGRAQA